MPYIVTTCYNCGNVLAFRLGNKTKKCTHCDKTLKTKKLLKQPKKVKVNTVSEARETIKNWEEERSKDKTGFFTYSLKDD